MFQTFQVFALIPFVHFDSLSPNPSIREGRACLQPKLPVVQWLQHGTGQQGDMNSQSQVGKAVEFRSLCFPQPNVKIKKKYTHQQIVEAGGTARLWVVSLCQQRHSPHWAPQGTNEDKLPASTPQAHLGAALQAYWDWAPAQLQVANILIFLNPFHQFDSSYVDFFRTAILST